MSFQWLKRYMPRSLYGRAALILILPVVTVQLVVSVVFIKRHFEGVTEQMTHVTALELRLILTDINASQTRLEALQRVDVLRRGLEIGLRFPDPPPDTYVNQWRAIDLTGSFVIKKLMAQMPNLRSISLPNSQRADLLAETDHGILQITLKRQRLSASNAHQLLVNMVLD